MNLRKSAVFDNCVKDPKTWLVV